MLPASKSNRITVDRGQYRYIVSESGPTQDSVVPLAVTVQHLKNGARLRIVGLTTRRVPEERSKFYMGRTVERNIEPRHVAQLIKVALSHGWMPTSPGPVFILQAAGID